MVETLTSTKQISRRSWATGLVAPVVKAGCADAHRVVSEIEKYPDCRERKEVVVLNRELRCSGSTPRPRGHQLDLDYALELYRGSQSQRELIGGRRGREPQL